MDTEPEASAGASSALFCWPLCGSSVICLDTCFSAESSESCEISLHLMIWNPPKKRKEKKNMTSEISLSLTQQCFGVGSKYTCKHKAWLFVLHWPTTVRKMTQGEGEKTVIQRFEQWPTAADYVHKTRNQFNFSPPPFLIRTSSHLLLHIACIWLNIRSPPPPS